MRFLPNAFLWTEADGAEVHVEIFELRGPVSADPAFDAGARGPTHPGRVKTGENGSTRPLRSLSGDATSGVQFAVGETAGSVEQHGWSDQNAGAAAHGAEPGELLGQRRGDVAGAVAAAWANQHRKSALAAALKVAFQTGHPSGHLPIIAKLATADDAIDVIAGRTGRHDGSGKRVGDGLGIGGAAQAVADVAADIEAGPVVDRLGIHRRLGIGPHR